MRDPSRTNAARLAKSAAVRLRSRAVLPSLLIAALGLGAWAASPALASTDYCTTGSSGGNTNTCIDLNAGDGSQVQGSAHIYNATRTLSVCVTENSSTLGCTPWVSVAPGQTLYERPGLDVPPATYCSTTYRLNSDGSNTEIGRICAYGS